MKVLAFFKSQAAYDEDRLNKYFDSNDVSGGFSVHPKSGEPPKDGFMVAHEGPKLQMSKKDWDSGDSRRKQVGDFMKKNQDYFKKNPNANLGGWYNKTNDKYEIEPSHHYKDKDEAIGAGKKNNQISIFDVAGGAEIETGGTGVYDNEKKKKKK